MEKIQERDKRMIHHVEKCLEARDERSSAHLTFQKDKNVTLIIIVPTWTGGC